MLPLLFLKAWLILQFQKVVEKHSALLEIESEEQIPVDANHEEICKFTKREDEIYEKIFKRIGRMIKEKGNNSCVVLIFIFSLTFFKYLLM